MKNIPGFPAFEVQFDKDGAVFDPAEVAALKDHLSRNGTTDLIALSHGWNNDMDEARALYEELLTNAADLLREGKVPGAAGRKFAVLAALWPSKKFAEKDLISGGAAGVSGRIDVAQVRAKIDALADAFDAPGAAESIDRLKKLVPKLEDSAAACREFVETARNLLAGKPENDEDAPAGFMNSDGLALFNALAQPISFTEEVGAGAAGGGAIGSATGLGNGQGNAAGLTDFFDGALSGARNMMNLVTYYKMKERAGLVGAKGLNPLLREIRGAHPELRIHLVGHSFGGRLVVAAVAGSSPAEVLRANSMSLLQAAFSHHGFAEKWDGVNDGFFRRVITEKAISGPVIITCTANDRAVGVAYAIASLVAQQTAAGIGGPNSKYGGIGRNGAQKTKEADRSAMVAAGEQITLRPGRLHNLNADRFIKDHSDVRNRNVAYAVLSAIAT